MKVSKLRQLLEDLNDDDVVVTRGIDHSYQLVREIEEVTALTDGMGYYYEDHGDDYKDNRSDKRIAILIIY